MCQRRSILLFAFALTVLGCRDESAPPASSQTGSTVGFVHCEHRTSSGQVSRYVIFVPSTYRPSIPTPVILFLHGAGQTGSDGLAPIRGGLAAAIRSRESSFPFLVIFPQSKSGSWSADSRDGKLAMDILGDVERRYPIDLHRIYLTGYSMGGEGTWSIAGAYPDRFAAIVPITPGENEKVVSEIAHIPCWCFQGANDDGARVNRTRAMMLKLKKSGGIPIYEEFAELEHNCWDAAYSKDELYEWMLQHSIHP